jgi:hypothetical protein
VKLGVETLSAPICVSSALGPDLSTRLRNLFGIAFSFILSLLADIGICSMAELTLESTSGLGTNELLSDFPP